MDMHAAYREVGSYRAAADICGTTPKTVKRSVEAARRAEAGFDPGLVRHNYDGVADLVAETVARTKGRITAKRLLPVAVAAGYGGSARNFRRLVAEAKSAWRSKNHRGRRPGVWAPGRHGGVRLGRDRPAVRLLCGGRLESVSLRLLHRQPRGRGHHGGPGRMLRAHRRGAEDRPHRPHGLPEGRHGRRPGHPDTGLRALRHPLRVPARLLRGGRPRVQRPGREPGRLREVRPHDPRALSVSDLATPTRRDGPGATRSTASSTPRSAPSPPSG